MTKLETIKFKKDKNKQYHERDNTAVRLLIELVNKKPEKVETGTFYCAPYSTQTLDTLRSIYRS